MHGLAPIYEANLGLISGSYLRDIASRESRDRLVEIHVQRERLIGLLLPRHG